MEITESAVHIYHATALIGIGVVVGLIIALIVIVTNLPNNNKS
jgi:hypothetical protein